MRELIRALCLVEIAQCIGIVALAGGVLIAALAACLALR